MLRYLWISVAVVILDQASKFAVLRYVAHHAQIELLPFLNLTLTFNSGAAFGFLNQAGGLQNVFFLAVAVIASVIIVLWLRRLHPAERLTGAGLGLVLGGAIGNLLDRLMYGYVIDFIDVVFGSWHFWTFNIADSAITAGAVLLIWHSLFTTKG